MIGFEIRTDPGPARDTPEDRMEMPKVGKERKKAKTESVFLGESMVSRWILSLQLRGTDEFRCS